MCFISVYRFIYLCRVPYDLNNTSNSFKHFLIIGYILNCIYFSQDHLDMEFVFIPSLPAACGFDSTLPLTAANMRQVCSI